MKKQFLIRDKITIYQYFITFLMSSFNTISFFHFLTQLEEIDRFILLTWWNFYISSIFFIVILICDTNLFIFKSKRLEHINYYFRNHFYPVILIYSIFVSIIFWGIINPLSGYKQMGEDFYTIFRNYNVHGLIVIFLFIDMYFAERDKYSFNNNDAFIDIWNNILLFNINTYNEKIF